MSASTATDLPVLRLGDAAVWQDLQSHLAEARERAAFARTDAGLVVALRYAEVDSILRSNKFEFGDLIAAVGQTSGPFYDWWHRTISAFNPPAHTRLRRLLGGAFSPKRVNQLRVLITALVNEALDPCLAKGHMDIVDFAHVLPMRVMGAVLGVPREEHAIFEELTITIAKGFHTGTAEDPVLVQKVFDSLAKLTEYSERLVAQKRAQPQDDLISTLLQERDGNDQLTTQELVDHIVFMLFAGHDTTRSTLSIATMLLGKHQDQTQLIREDPSLAEPAVEEIMRFESPVMLTTRQPIDDAEIDGVQLPAGVPVGVSLTSAARDTRGMPDADVFNVRRTDKRGIGFGSGLHFCLGATLARAELQEAVRAIATRTSEVRLAEEPRWYPFKAVRGFDEVRLKLTPR